MFVSITGMIRRNRRVSPPVRSRSQTDPCLPRRRLAKSRGK